MRLVVNCGRRWGTRRGKVTISREVKLQSAGGESCNQPKVDNAFCVDLDRSQSQCVCQSLRARQIYVLLTDQRLQFDSYEKIVDGISGNGGMRGIIRGRIRGDFR